MKPTTRLTADLLASDTAHLLHPFTDFAQYKKAPGRTYVRGEGVHIIDSEGANYWMGCQDFGAPIWAIASRPSSTPLPSN